MYILQRLPDMSEIKAVPFILGSRKVFLEALRCVQKFFKEGTEAYRMWSDWDATTVPQSDDVREHLMRFFIVYN